MSKFINLREKYPTFIYHTYHIEKFEDNIKLSFDFEIVGLTHFYPTILIPIKKNVDIGNSLFRYLVFHVGMIELVSYFKCTCSPNVIVEAGYLNNEQINWFQKLYYYGLGEFRYLNQIDVSLKDFMHITCNHPEENIFVDHYEGVGNLIPVGGGKDSCVTLELLKDFDNDVFIINPKTATLECAKIGGYENKTIGVKRTIDKKLLELNEQGFLNGHTPFSSLVAFLSYLVGYINGKKYIVLSNEASANESTVLGTKINHQYSKTYEFENDFNDYTKKYFGIDISYFSLLRPISELQIGMLFSKLKKYHSVFKSCNVGSKEKEWNWCSNCPKCLFVYIILSPFLTKEELIHIFKEDLLDKKELLPIFLELLGYSKTKPFECVGTFEEVRYAISLTVKLRNDNPYLIKYYLEHYPLVKDSFLDSFNEENNVPEEFIKILRSELENARKDN